MAYYLLLIDTLSLMPGATCYVSHKVADSLSAEGHNVVILTLGSTNRTYEEATGTTVKEIKSLTYKTFYGINSRSTTADNLFTYLTSRIVQIFFFAIHHTYMKAYPTKRMLREAIRIVMKANEKVRVVSFSEPFSTHILGHRLKQRLGEHIVWAAYEMDPYALNYTRPKEEEAANRAFEKEILSNADLLIFANAIKEENDKRGHLIEYDGKSISLPIPGLTLPTSLATSGNRSRRQKKVRLIYTGMFYPEFRTPETLITLLEQASFDYELHLYGSIDEKLFLNHEAVYRHCIFHGRCSKQECDEACAEGDVLIDVQNDISNQIPSKLLSYISLGKPIVTFYTAGYEAGIQYLDAYPNALCIEKTLNNLARTSDLFNQFCVTEYEPVSQAIIAKALAPYLHATVMKRLQDAIDRIA